MEEDLYQILGVSSDATPLQIKEAYLYKVNVLHPDRLSAMPERIRLAAEDELKKVNAAYEVLSDPARRREYDAGRKGVVVQPSSPTSPLGKPPKPQVHPKTVELGCESPYVPAKGSFYIRNVGGDFEKIFISEPPEWLKIVRIVSLQDGSKLPMRVDIEAVGIQWGKVYSSDIIVRLDDRKTKVKVELRVKKKSWWPPFLE